jgi:hypothetical protein
MGMFFVVSAEQIGRLLANGGNLIDHVAGPSLVPRSEEESGSTSLMTLTAAIIAE